MNVESPVETPRVKDAASCRAWLARLAQGDTSRLLSVDLLLRGLSRSSQAPDLVLEIAEQARPVHVAEIAGVIDRLDSGRVPMPERDRSRLSTAVESLRLGRDLYKGIHVALIAGAEASAHAVIPGATNSLRVVMPLARALDYQVRLLVALQRLRVAIDPGDWDELCTLAGHLRASSFIDTKLPDEAPLLAAGTSRALFVYPLLIWLAGPYQRNPAEFALIARLARRWAGRVGFRLEDRSGSSDTRHGPSVALTGTNTVRLVTHRLQRRIETRLSEIEELGTKAVPRLPRGLSLDATRRLLNDLIRRWCEPRLLMRIPDARLGEMRLRFGMPSMPEAPGEAGDESPAGRRGARGRSGDGARAARNRQTPRKPASWHSAASRAYIYGRFEHNSIIRTALGDAPNADPLSHWALDAEHAAWVSIEREQAVFEGCLTGEGIELGALALVLPPPIERLEGMAMRDPRSEPSPKRIFGRIVALSQQMDPDPRQTPRLRISIAVWSGPPTLVGVRSGDDPFFHDAFMLTPDEATGESICLIAPAGHFRGPGEATLREVQRDRRVRFEELLDRGPGYDRIKLTRLQL